MTTTGKVLTGVAIVLVATGIGVGIYMKVKKGTDGATGDGSGSGGGGGGGATGDMKIGDPRGGAAGSGKTDPMVQPVSIATLIPNLVVQSANSTPRSRPTWNQQTSPINTTRSTTTKPMTATYRPPTSPLVAPTTTVRR